MGLYCHEQISTMLWKVHWTMVGRNWENGVPMDGNIPWKWYMRTDYGDKSLVFVIIWQFHYTFWTKQDIFIGGMLLTCSWWCDFNLLFENFYLLWGHMWLCSGLICGSVLRDHACWCLGNKMTYQTSNFCWLRAKQTPLICYVVSMAWL